MILFEGQQEIPAHLLCMFELLSDPTEDIVLSEFCTISAKGIYVLAHILPASLNYVETGDKMERAQPDTRLLFRCQKWDVAQHGKDDLWNKVITDRAVAPTLQVYHTDMIEGPVIAFPDFYYTAQPEHNHIYYLIAPHKTWGPDFIKLSREFCEQEETEAGLRQGHAAALKLKRERAKYRYPRNI